MPKISELPAAGALDGAELVPVTQDGETVQTTVSAIGACAVAEDATLAALSGTAWLQNAIPVGTGNDTLEQVLLAANNFLARGSTGDVETKAITDAALTFLAAANQTAMRSAIGAQASDATLDALAAFATNGLLARTGADTFAGRTITGTANRIAVTNGDGVAGNPTLDISNNALAEGTYSPVAAALSNLSSVNAGVITYVRTLNRVRLFGIITVDAVAAGAAQFELPLPIASNFAASENAGGSGAVNDTTYLPVQIFASAANDRLIFRWVASGTSALVISFTADYAVI